MNEFQLFDRQKALFASERTRWHAWRVEQLDNVCQPHSFADLETWPSSVQRGIQNAIPFCNPTDPK